MPYNEDTNWTTWASRGSNVANQLIGALMHVYEDYYNWQTFRAARSNAEIATALGKDEADIAALDAVFSAGKEMHDFANNVAGPTQGDRFYQLRVFS